MALASGTRLGPFEVLALIGEGGMGEVYKARDTRLDRTVAIKVLLSGAAADPEQRRRFEQEARAVSALNHPHICVLHDVGREGDVDFLVLEYLDGQTLAQRLSKGPLPVDEAVEYAMQIVDALDKAHRQGIVHRDLKPSNVLLTRAGVKVLDFGLAKLRAPEAAGLADPSLLQTRPSPLTTQGTILGTLAYMSPEQVQGQEADARSDIFSFGAMFHEMLTGKAAFQGANAASVIAAILDRDPAPVTTLDPAIPPVLGLIVKACLAKDLDDRVQSAHDLLLDLRRLRDASSQTMVVAAASPRVRRRRVLIPALWFLAGAVIAAGIVAATSAARVVPRGVVRFTIEVPASRDLGSIALSPDGRRLAYVGTEAGRAQVFVRAFDQLEDAPVRGTDEASSPFFSPDGGWIGFFAGAQLRKVPLSGGQALTICDAKASDPELTSKATWADDDTIVFSAGTSALSRVPAAGGSPVAVTMLDPARHDLSHTWPAILPGGAGALFTVTRGVAFDQFHVNAMSLQTRRVQMILPVGAAASYLATGHVLYVKGTALLAVRYDATRMQTIGTPAVVVDAVGFLTRPGTGSVRQSQPQYSVSRAGDLAYASPAPAATAVVVRVDRAGRRTPILELPSGFRGAVSLSPDGRWLATYRGEAHGYSLWTLDVGRGILTRLVGQGNPHAPIWSPDGERLAFSQDHAETSNLFMQVADASSPAELLVTSAQHDDPGSWSRDGRWIAYAEASSDTGWDLWTLDLTSRQATPFRQAPAAQQQPAISPDGQRVAYASNETGTFQVYVEAFPSGGRRIQISPDGGTEPLWAPNGRELLYRRQQRLMSVKVDPGPAFAVSRPVQVLDAPFLAAATYGPPAYAIAPDGRSFYFIEVRPEPATPRSITIVLGWAEELERRLGTAGR